MSRYVEFLGRDGKMYRAEQRGIDNALPYIEERIERLMPEEVVSIEKVKKLIKDVHVGFKRDITKEEANQVIEVIKKALIDEMDKLDKYYIDKEKLEE